MVFTRYLQSLIYGPFLLSRVIERGKVIEHSMSGYTGRWRSMRECHRDSYGLVQSSVDYLEEVNVDHDLPSIVLGSHSLGCRSKLNNAAPRQDLTKISKNRFWRQYASNGSTLGLTLRSYNSTCKIMSYYSLNRITSKETASSSKEEYDGALPACAWLVFLCPSGSMLARALNPSGSACGVYLLCFRF